MSDLTTRIRAKFPGAYDDMSDADLEKAVLAKHPEYADLASKHEPTAPAQQQGDLGHYAGYKRIGDAVMSAGKAAIDHPVQSLAAIGSLAAVPLTGGASLLPGMAAAGLGAAGGAGIGSIVNAIRGGENGPRTAGDVAKTMATEGALGAAGEGAGRGVAAGLQAGATRIYRGVLRPSAPLQREFGSIVKTGLDEGIPVSERGARTAGDRMSASANDARSMIASAAPNAPPVRVGTEVGKETIPIVQRADLRAATGLPNEAPQIVTRIKAMQKANPGGVDLQTAQDMKGELQDLAARVYRAQDKGAPVVDLGADTNAAMARGLRQAVEARVPGVGPVNSRTQDLMGLRHALENANARNVGIGVKSLIGDTTPGLMSGAAIAAHKAAPYAPTLLRSLLAALGYQE